MVQVRIELFLDTSELEREFETLVPDIRKASTTARRAAARELRKMARKMLRHSAGIHYEPTIRRRISPQPRRVPHPTVWFGANPANAMSFLRSQVVPGKPPGERPRSTIRTARDPEHLEIDGVAIPNAFIASPHGVPFAFVPSALRDAWTSPLSDVVLNRGGVVSIEIEDVVSEVAERLQNISRDVLRKHFVGAIEQQQ